MDETSALNGLRTLLDPGAVAAWLDEVESYRTLKAVKVPVAPPVIGAKHDVLLTVKELCERLQVSPTWVYEMTRQNAIPHVRVGRHVRFRWAEIEAWLEEEGRSE